MWRMSVENSARRQISAFSARDVFVTERAVFSSWAGAAAPMPTQNGDRLNDLAESQILTPIGLFDLADGFRAVGVTGEEFADRSVNRLFEFGLPKRTRNLSGAIFWPSRA